VSKYADAVGGWNQANTEVNFETFIEWVQRTLRRHLGGRNPVSLEMNFDDKCKWTDICTLKAESSKCKNALGDHNQTGFMIHLNAMITQNWRSSWRWSICRWYICRQSIWRRSNYRKSICRQSIYKQSTWRGSIWPKWICKRWMGKKAWQLLRHYLLVNSELWECLELSQPRSTEGWESGRGQNAVHCGMYSVLGVCHTQCRLYSVPTSDSGL